MVKQWTRYHDIYIHAKKSGNLKITANLYNNHKSKGHTATKNASAWHQKLTDLDKVQIESVTWYG